MVTKYINKEGEEISKSVYDDLYDLDEYRIVKQFENDKVRLFIVWSGKIENADSLFPSSYPLFVAVQHDYMPDKQEWCESIESGRTFSNIKKANDFYNDFLMQWTESFIDLETGDMQEVGNKLAPPPPPPPASAPTGDYEFTAW